MVGENLYHTGGGLKIGYKYIASNIPCDETNSTIVVSLRVQKTSSEAQEMTQMAIDAKLRLPGLLGAITDTALRGEHNYQLMRKGLVPINPIAAAELAADGKTRLKEKTGKWKVMHHLHPAGYMCEHDIHYYAGGLREWRPNAAGELEAIDFGDPRILERQDKAGSRLYAEYRITCRDGRDDGEADLQVGIARINSTTEPTGAKNELNIPENIRLVPYGRRVSKRVYGWRNNTENDNRQRDLRKFGGRANSHGATRQHWNEIGAAILENGVAILLDAERTSAQSTTEPTKAPTHEVDVAA